MSKHSTKKEMSARLSSCMKKGKNASKTQDKQDCKDSGQNFNDFSRDKLYSTATYEQYKGDGKDFIDAAEQKGLDIKDLESLRSFAPEWIKTNKNGTVGAASTQRHRAAALGKIFGCSGAEIAGVDKLPTRKSEDIKNNRHGHERYGRNGKYKDCFDFIEATGLRRRELAHLQGTDLIVNADGSAVIHVRKGSQGGAKGGKERWAVVRGEYAPAVISACREAGSGNVFGDKAGEDGVLRLAPAETHVERGTYALAYYRELCPLTDEELRAEHKRGELFFPRKEHLGEVYLKSALDDVNQSLGHGSDRGTLLVHNYFHG